MAKKRTILDVPKEVRERYYRIKYAKSAEGIARRYSRLTLPIRESRRNRALDKALSAYKKETKRASETENDCVKTLMNMGLYVLLAEKDIQCIKIDAITHPDPWRRNLLLRVILLTIYEWNMGKVGTGNLKEMLIKSNVTEELQSELFQSLRELRKSQKDAARQLQQVRNSVIAHRDPDALLQLNIIENLEPKRVFEAAELFYVSSERFLEIFPKVLSQAGSVSGLFSYMLKSNTT